MSRDRVQAVAQVVGAGAQVGAVRHAGLPQAGLAVQTEPPEVAAVVGAGDVPAAAGALAENGQQVDLGVALTILVLVEVERGDDLAHFGLL